MPANTRITELHDNETGVLFRYTTLEDFSTYPAMVHLDQLANAFTCAAEARWLRSGAQMIIEGSMTQVEKEKYIEIFGFMAIRQDGEVAIDENNLAARLELLEQRELELRGASRLPVEIIR